MKRGEKQSWWTEGQGLSGGGGHVTCVPAVCARAGRDRKGQGEWLARVGFSKLHRVPDVPQMTGMLWIWGQVPP